MESPESSRMAAGMRRYLKLLVRKHITCTSMVDSRRQGRSIKFVERAIIW